MNGKADENRARRWMSVMGLGLLIALPCASGCGGGGQKQNANFYTSGSREADERADQRMAQAQQLEGGGEATGDKPAVSDTKRSLYDRLGGDAGLTAISDDFVIRVMADPRVNWDRQGVVQGGFSIHHDRSVEWKPTPEDVKTLKLHLTQFLALATGGPAVYQGREMKSAHADLHISNPEFDAAVGDLKATLDKLQIANTEQKELLAVIETTRAEVVTER